MRKLGAEVDCAADIIEARSWWRADLYNLILVSVDASHAQTEKFCSDVRKVMPQQQIMFFVGKPEYLSSAPGDGQILPANEPLSEKEPPLIALDQVKAALSADGSSHFPQRWGILEACRRISEVRSKIDAKSRAMRDRPAPQRDSEASRPRSKEAAEAANLLDVAELLREEAE